MQSRFDKFTQSTRKALQCSQEEARRLNHDYIGTEHLLLGLLREGQGVAARALASLGVELTEARRSVEVVIGRGDRTPSGAIGLTPRAKKTIELSVDEARRLNHHYIGTEHLLLGLLREGEGIGAGVLESLGLNLDEVRRAVVEVLNRPADYRPAARQVSRRRLTVPAARRLEPIPEDWQCGLAIVAHPDDLEFGAAGAIARWTAAGKQVSYLLATRGEAGIDSLPPEQAGPLREAEERASARIVGVETVEFLDLRDGVVEYGLDLRRDLARAIRRLRPEVVLTSHFGLAWPGDNLNQADHRAVGLAACDAVRDAGNRWIFPELVTEGFEPWSGVRWLFVLADPEAGHACDISDHFERSLASLQAHKLYLENLAGGFDPEKFLRQQAAEAGATLGCRYAASFRVLKV